MQGRLQVLIMTANKNKYDHFSRASKGGSAWRWVVIAAVCLWNTGRIAALFGYHDALGSLFSWLSRAPGTGHGSSCSGPMNFNNTKK
jgi:hypothetical protein